MSPRGSQGDREGIVFRLSTQSAIPRLTETAQGQEVERRDARHTGGTSVVQQPEAISCGRVIEHCCQFAAPVGFAGTTLGVMWDRIYQGGVDHVIVSSHLGEVSNRAIAEAFIHYPGELR